MSYPPISTPQDLRRSSIMNSVRHILYSEKGKIILKSCIVETIIREPGKKPRVQLYFKSKENRTSEEKGYGILRPISDTVEIIGIIREINARSSSYQIPIEIKDELKKFPEEYVTLKECISEIKPLTEELIPSAKKSDLLKMIGVLLTQKYILLNTIQESLKLMFMYGFIEGFRKGYEKAIKANELQEL